MEKKMCRLTWRSKFNLLIKKKTVDHQMLLSHQWPPIDRLYKKVKKLKLSGQLYVRVSHASAALWQAHSIMSAKSNINQNVSYMTLLEDEEELIMNLLTQIEDQINSLQVCYAFITMICKHLAVKLQYTAPTASYRSWRSFSFW